MTLGAVLCAAAFAAQPPEPAPRTPQDPQEVARPAAVPDDEFIEFLGTDDVGEAAWWEFLKNSAHGRTKPPAPPQDTKQ